VSLWNGCNVESGGSLLFTWQSKKQEYNLIMITRSQTKKQKIDYLKSQGNGFHRWGGALYEVLGSKYRQMYAESSPASGWRKL